jgi:NADPH:quinone reductase-like Zn-dependent oxidoreductase
VRHNLRAFVAKSNLEDLRLLEELIEAGKLAPLLERTFSLNEGAEALRHLEEKSVQGEVATAI